MATEAFCCEVRTTAAENEARLMSTNIIESFFRIVNINGVVFFAYRGNPINVDLVSRPESVLSFLFTSSVHANAVDRRFDK